MSDSSKTESWFGELDLAWKYAIVFGSLIVLTMLAGACKVFYNHRRLKKFAAAENVEAGKKDDQVELNQREKDEGDLFGIRAIEAGFFGGVHQSRPTSRAGSFVETGSRGTSTLLGGVSNALTKDGYSMTAASSVTVLPLAHTAGDRDSSNSPPRRKSPPTIRLAPSEAELSGRINHNVAVNMNLHVPPSPVLGRHPQSPTFGGSDTESDGRASPATLSPRSPTFPDHYVPLAPQIPMPSGLSVTVHAPEEPARSQAASFNDISAPSSRGPSPQTALPSIPTQALRDEPSQTPPNRPSSPPRLLPQTYQPTHQRDMSDASSVYEMNRASMHQSTSSTDSSSYNFSFPDPARRNSGGVSNVGSLNSSSSQNNRQSTFLSAGAKNTDPRLSEFYDAYYRQSQLINPSTSTSETSQKRPNQLNLAQETIVEVESPLPSPNPNAPLMGPGSAL